ncbi:TetR family transcriptional regulator [Streptomyces sp. B-S-A8]|uniref:TetR family transcriptional regulator n=1 Tax=Streptomyces solicavernae TaxID=3043614 RepID=A0ABT6RST9_9ACTN|nr:TetR family transcriptional regulator [Streptomyces sp. B-S-A8]MDI3387501.1 TetR family transcriptional regulator [Streptomyces sp. B-S-A8]
MSTEQISATRPRNRRQLIVEAAGRLFSERGYHAASMEDIAARVGISAAALYRHFPNKYALFAECAHTLVDRLVAALDPLPPDAAPADVFTALARVTVAHRASGGVYRWEARYLDRADRRLLRAKFARVVGRVTEAVRREVPLPDGQLRAVAALGAIGSITMHRTSIAQRRAEDLLSACALRVAATDPAPPATDPATDPGPPATDPGPPATDPGPPATDPGPPATDPATDPAPPVAGPRRVELPALPVPHSRRAEILAAAVPLFARDGFAHVTNGQIARAVGLAPSALYRHYPGKVDILAAACLQAARLLAQAVDRNLRGVAGPREAVEALAATYVAYSFEHTALTSVAEAEFVGLPAALRRPLVQAQREHIAGWERQLRLARPGLDPRQARVLVHAGFGVVVEAGRHLRWRDTPGNRAAVTGLVVGALGL